MAQDFEMPNHLPNKKHFLNKASYCNSQFFFLISIVLTEAPLLIRPYLPEMTNSEIHAVMTGGFATIAGSVLGAYISFGVTQ